MNSVDVESRRLRFLTLSENSMNNISRFASTIAIAAMALIPFSSDIAQANTPGGGTHSHIDAVDAYNTDSYTLYFSYGMAVVEVKGDGSTDLDCYVSLMNGIQIASDTRDSDYCRIIFPVEMSGNFRLSIRNFGPVYNDYLMAWQ